MPELPDVEIFRQYLDATGLHQEIAAARVLDERLLEGISAGTLRRRVAGRRLTRTARHGKHVFAALDDDNGWLMLHFGMTGSLRYFRRRDRRPGPVGLELRFSNGYRLVYVSQRRLGRVALADSPAAYARKKELGPDALEGMDATAFRRRLASRRGGLKSALTNQQVIAGVGNVYADEILFQARLHPGTPVKSLRRQGLDRVHQALRQVLGDAVEARADPERMPAGFLLSRRREDASCPRCGSPIRKITVAGRATYLCPRCQTQPASSSD